MSKRPMCIRYTGPDPAGTFYFYCTDGGFYTRTEMHTKQQFETQYETMCDVNEAIGRLSVLLDMPFSKFDAPFVPPKNVHGHIANIVKNLIDV